MGAATAGAAATTVTGHSMTNSIPKTAADGTAMNAATMVDGMITATGAANPAMTSEALGVPGIGNSAGTASVGNATEEIVVAGTVREVASGTTVIAAPTAGTDGATATAGVVDIVRIAATGV